MSKGDLPAGKKTLPPSKRHPRKHCGDNGGPITKAGKPCARWALKGRDRCRWHNGGAARGEASQNFIHGGRSAYLPPDLARLFDAASTDSELMKLRQDVQLVEALLRGLTVRLKAGKAVPLAMENRVLGLVEQRRKLLDSEAKRMRDLQLMISADRAMRMQVNAATITAEVIREICARGVEAGSDPNAWLTQVRIRYDRLRLPAVSTDEEPEGET